MTTTSKSCESTFISSFGRLGFERSITIELSPRHGREVYVNAVRPRRQGFTKKGLSWQWGSTFCDAHVIVFTWPDTTSESFRGSESDPDDMQIHMSLKGHPLSFACLSGLRYDTDKGVDLNAWDLMPQFPFAVPFKYYLGWTLRTLVARDQASLPISWIYEVLANSWDKFGVRVTFSNIDNRPIECILESLAKEVSEANANTYTG